MIEDRVPFRQGMLPSLQSIFFAKLGEIIQQNASYCKIFDERFHPNPRQQELFDLIDTCPIEPEEDGTQVPIHVQCYGPTGCLAEDTFIPFVILDENGRRVNKKGGSIRRLYERFHRLTVLGIGKNRIVPLGHTFHIASADEESGRIFQNRVEDVIDNGVRPVFELLTSSGRTILATSNHPFLTPRGYVPLGALCPGDTLLVHTNSYHKNGRKGRIRRYTVNVKWHPGTTPQFVNGHWYHRVSRARATVEASMNGMGLKEYLEQLNRGEGYCRNLIHLSREFEVHHKDGNCQNDCLENLEVLSKDAHHKLHEDQSNEHISRYAAEESVVSITPKGSRRVYDVTMASATPNFVAQGFVVHNSSKSYGVYCYVIRKLLEYPGAQALFVRHKLTDIKKSAWKDVKKILDRYGIPYTKNETDFTLTLPNGSGIVMSSDLALTPSGSDKADSLGSTAYSYVVFEEADSIRETTAITMAGRMREAIGNFRKVLFYICNPPDRHHWLYRRFFGGGNDPHDPLSRYRVLQFSVEDNVKHVGMAYLKGIKEDFAHNRFLAKRLGEGEYGIAPKGRPYFMDTFFRDKHVTDLMVEGKDGVRRYRWNRLYPLQRGWDPGFTGMGLTLFQEDPELKQCRVFVARLISHTHLEDFLAEVLPELNRLFPGARWEDFIDPAAQQERENARKSSLDILRSYGLHPRYKPSSPKYGLSVINRLLRVLSFGQPRLVLDKEGAQVLIDAFEGGYCCKENTDLPLKDGVYDHVMDSFRYAVSHIYSLGENDASVEVLGSAADASASTPNWAPVNMGDKLFSMPPSQAFSPSPSNYYRNPFRRY